MSYQSASVSMSHLICESYGHSFKNGSHALNATNFNEAVRRVYNHGYFKPRFAQWPTGGYTRSEAIHRVRNEVLDTGPQSYEWSNYGYGKAGLGIAKGVRQSNLSTGRLERSLSEGQLLAHSAGMEPAPRPTSDGAESAKTNTNLCMATNVQTDGKAYEPQGKYIQISDPYGWIKPPNFIPFSDRRLNRALSDFNTQRFSIPSADRPLC